MMPEKLLVLKTHFVPIFWQVMLTDDYFYAQNVKILSSPLNSHWQTTWVHTSIFLALHGYELPKIT